MTMQHLLAPMPLLPCRNGHAARYILDKRGLHCGGGHFIECACRQTQRLAGFELARAAWDKVNGRRKPKAKPDAVAAMAVKTKRTARDASQPLLFPLDRRKKAAAS